MRPKEMIQSLLMVGWTEIGIAQFCGVSQATVNRNRHALYGNPRFNLVDGLQELMENPTPINRTRDGEVMTSQKNCPTPDTVGNMALRDYFAAKAMASLMLMSRDQDLFLSDKDMAEMSYEMADEMLKARKASK